MPTPTGSSAWRYSALSGDKNVDSLISGTQWTNTPVTYSFAGFGSYWSTDSSSGYGASTGNGEPWNDSYALSASDMVAVRQAFAAWSAVAQIRFSEVLESQTRVGDIRLAYSGSVTQQAHAYYPGSSPKSGDVWVNSNGTSATNEWTAGSYYYMTAIHEIGHAIGLKHPFEGASQNSTISSAAWDTRSFTIMSYSARAGDSQTHFSYEPTTPMLLDILAVQHLYGANHGWKPGNDVYRFDGASAYHQTIWDGGGIDTIAYNASVGGTIDLRDGQASVLGTPVNIVSSAGSVLDTVKNIWIAYGTVIENAVGGSGNDDITGNAAANILNGGGGADTMLGGAGNDTYVVDNAGDRVYETTAVGGAINAGGTDTVRSSLSYTLGSFVEKLVLTGSNAINGTGNALANTLTGNAAANTLNGRGGADTLLGGAGNDIYVVDNAGDRVYETTAVGGAINAGGTDTVRSSLSYTLGSFVEKLVLTGSNAINGTGNALANTLTGNAAANILDGRGGADTLLGGAGNDTYVVDNAGDKVYETTTIGGAVNSGGSDTVRSSVTYTLGNFVEKLTLTGLAAINGSGNALANALVGNGAANILRGANGNDVLVGGAGADTLYGGAHNDLLRGGAGSDVLFGGAGSDIFRFDTALSTSTVKNVDWIRDFDPAQDTIQLENSIFTRFGTGTTGPISPALFRANTTGLAQDGNDYLIYETDTGKLFYDANGSAAGGSVQIALLQANLALSSADYALV